MQTWLLNDTNGLDSYTLDEIDAPEPGPGEVRIEVRTSGLNHLDLWVSMGLPAPKHFPHISGGDGAGIVDKTGEDVKAVATGDEVVINPSVSCGHCAACLRGDITYCANYGVLGEHLPGTLAEYAVVPARNTVEKPASLSWEEAGAYALAYGTAFRMLRRARLEAGERLLVVGVGGGVASAGLMIGKALGARVFVTSRSQEKIDRALEYGAEMGFDSAGEFSREIRVEVGDIDVVFETVGPATFEQSFRSLGRGGRVVIGGATSGRDLHFIAQYLFFKQNEIIGSAMFDHGELQKVTDLVARRDVPIIVDSVFEFDELPKALGRMDSAEQFGKIVLRH